MPAQPNSAVCPGGIGSLHKSAKDPHRDFAALTGRAVDQTRCDGRCGWSLIPHTVDVDTGEPTSGARGSSQSIINRFLPEIEPEFAKAQYVRFQELFLSAPLGVGPAVREFPHGVDGPADVDSGPLPLGIGLSATVVTLGAAKVNGDASWARGLANFGEVAGLPLDTPSTRRYAFGVEPVGDAFLAWSKSARPWVAAPPAALPRILSRW